MPPPDFITYLFTQGVLGVVCAGLIWVVIYQQRKLDKKDSTIQALNDGRLLDAKDVQKDFGGILSGNSQNMALLSEKIVNGKGN